MIDMILAMILATGVVAGAVGMAAALTIYVMYAIDHDWSAFAIGAPLVGLLWGSIFLAVWLGPLFRSTAP